MLLSVPLALLTWLKRDNTLKGNGLGKILNILSLILTLQRCKNTPEKDFEGVKIHLGSTSKGSVTMRTADQYYIVKKQPSSNMEGQALNPCLWCRVCFAHPRLCHGFKACQGLCPWTPRCIPTLVLAALHHNLNVGCATSQYQCWLHYIPILVLPRDCHG